MRIVEHGLFLQYNMVILRLKEGMVKYTAFMIVSIFLFLGVSHVENCAGVDVDPFMQDPVSVIHCASARECNCCRSVPEPEEGVHSTVFYLLTVQGYDARSRFDSVSRRSVVSHRAPIVRALYLFESSFLL